MELFPAIDLLGGRCVRLKKGEFGTARPVAGDPLETALVFYQMGARWIHMVDLDGARSGMGQNQKEILRVVQNTGLLVQVGGGIRDMAAIEAYLRAGAARVVIGSAAVRSPGLVQEAAKEFPDQIAVGIDAKDGRVRIQGWQEDAGEDQLSFARRMEQFGVQTLIVTDITKDGMLAGPGFSQLEAVQSAVSCRIIASGGIASLCDLERLKALGLYGAILGKALYAGAVDLAQAILKIQP